MTRVDEHPVLVVGAGPTGLTAALEFARMGVKVRVIDRADGPATTSRAIGVQARTLELLAQRGLADPLIARGHRAKTASVHGDGRRLFELDFANNGSRYGYLLFVSQADTEALLRDALAAAGVTIAWRTELVAFGQPPKGDRVTAVLRGPDGTSTTMDCTQLIAAEGAHSLARSTLAQAFEGQTRDEGYALGDLDVEGDLPEESFHIFSSVHGFLGLFPMGDRRFRLIASHPAESHDQAPDLAALQALYDQRAHIPATFAHLRWSSWFRINSRMVGRLRFGRVFLGGDAAHIHSPAGAQGMNTGMQDMIDLAWKLAFVARGWVRDDAREAFLDSYGDDRLPVMRDVLGHTEGLTDAIGTENRLFRTVFNHLAPALVATGFVQGRSTAQMSQVALGYRDSPLSTNDAKVGDLQAGDRVPDSAGLQSRLDPDAFTLLVVRSSDAARAESLGAAWHPVVGRVLRIDDATTFDDATGLVLVRPDGYAAFTGGIDALGDYLARWFVEPAKKLEDA